MLTEAELPTIKGDAYMRAWGTAASSSDRYDFISSTSGPFSKWTTDSAGYDMLQYVGRAGKGNVLRFSAGSDQPHNNMPPYLAVYVYKRIA